MKGLELARKFYEQHGKPMLGGQFSHILPFIAVGLTGSGSECYGYDDDVSQDHDFEPGFCIFCPMKRLLTAKPPLSLRGHIQSFPKNLWALKGAL
ncbi:MAG: hypothetical protein IKK49_01095 [Clostridia bacterium]|nr:hypothetical protein [Clostridia bacterium]